MLCNYLQFILKFIWMKEVSHEEIGLNSHFYAFAFI